MPKGGSVRGDGYFPRVREARELLREKALGILEDYIETVKAAQEAGDYEIALKSLQWLMEHMPEDEGQRMLETGVDKEKQVQKGNTGTAINIGVAIGGLPEASTAQPIEIKAIDNPDE
jgi:hypothetical protein